MKKDTQETAHKDPVCGMALSYKTAAAEATYQGKAYYFCSDMCREKFDANPERYVRRQSQP